MTHFDEKEIQLLQDCYKKLRSQSPSGRFDRDVLNKLFQSRLNDSLMMFLYNVMDDEGKGVIDMRDFVQNLSIISRGTFDDK